MLKINFVLIIKRINNGAQTEAVNGIFPVSPKT